MQRDLDGRDFNDPGKGVVEHEEITLPPEASARIALARLWNDIEKRENQHSWRASAQVAREIAFSLLVEMRSTPVECEMTL